MSRRRTLGLLPILALVVACGSSPGPSPSPATGAPATSPAPTRAAGPSPTPTPAPAAVYASIEADVEQIRGLRPTRAVDPQVLDEPALARLVADEFARDNPPAYVDATERLYKALGLMTTSQSLATLEVQLLSSQVAGLYDPDRKTLFVVSKTGSLGPVERVTFAHEFTHALQDQAFGLARLGVDEIGQGDRSLARLSLPEGDATLVMQDWAQERITPAEALQLLTESQDPQQTAILESMPAILRETLLFPYTSGLSFVTGVQASGGWAAVDGLYAKPPASTEQVLHPDRYAAGDAPVAIVFPADLAKRLGAGWSVPLVDTFGELQLRVWLREVGGLSDADAAAAAAGWGGDRLAVARDGERLGVAFETAWDSAADAAEFARAARQALAKLPLRTSLVDPGAGTRVSFFVASDDATVTRLAVALGLAG